MIYFKNANGDVFAYENQEERKQFGADDVVEMTEDEVLEHLTPQPTPEQISSVEREWRDGELARADIELNKVQDGMGVSTVSAWREYRCLLRDWPEHTSFPDINYRPAAPDANR